MSADSTDDEINARFGQPAEVAALIAYLPSDDASFLTGGVYTADGGSVDMDQ
jgi:NAD(P)-dependent dehydrogenase (short-subunit alcohol dehydrogenase family)